MRRALSLFAAAVVMLVSAKASASYHEMKVVEVFAGSAAQPNASYVQLQMYAAGQTFVNTHVLHVYAPNGTEITASSVTLNKDVTNGNDQANILIGTASVAGAFGVTPDFVLPANLDKVGGAVCWDVAIDCFSWGTFAGAAADGSVSPFVPVADKAARRIITGGASATLLENADDGNNNAMDFAAVDPAPKNNSFGATVVPDAGGVDASVPDGSTGKPDSGIGTMPSPNNPTVQPDSGASAPSSSSSGDSGGCSVVSSSSSSEGWSTVLGLFTAASILVLSRRRRAKR